MRRLLARSLVVGVPTLLFCYEALAAQSPVEGKLAAGFSEQVSVGYVLVPVVARSANGYARKLTRDDFRLTVDGKTVPIESFDVGTAAPVSVIFLQDLSGSMGNAGKLRLSRLAVERVLSAARAGDQYSLITFTNGELRMEVPFTTNGDAIDKAIGNWQPYGVTALHDAVFGLPTLTGAVQHAKRAAILITDGADNASEIEPRVARDRVRRAELPVYVLGLATGSPEVLDRQGNKLHRYADVLNLLAHLTGGQYFWISRVDELLRACSSVVSDLRHQYVLGFSTSDSEPSRYRHLVVTSRKENLRLTFRRGYEGPPPRLGAPTLR